MLCIQSPQGDTKWDIKLHLIVPGGFVKWIPLAVNSELKSCGDSYTIMLTSHVSEESSQLRCICVCMFLNFKCDFVKGIASIENKNLLSIFS